MKAFISFLRRSLSFKDANLLISHDADITKVKDCQRNLEASDHHVTSDHGISEQGLSDEAVVACILGPYWSVFF